MRPTKERIKIVQLMKTRIMLVITELFFKDSAGSNSSCYLASAYTHTPYHNTASNDMKAALLFLLYTSTAE